MHLVGYLCLAICHLISKVRLWNNNGAHGGLLGVLAVWVWDQHFQSPMFLGTQPPYTTKALIWGKKSIIQNLSFPVCMQVLKFILFMFNSATDKSWGKFQNTNSACAPWWQLIHFSVHKWASIKCKEGERWCQGFARSAHPSTQEKIKQRTRGEEQVHCTQKFMDKN